MEGGGFMSFDNEKFNFESSRSNGEIKDNLKSSDTEKTPVEKFIRALINKKEISVARSILSTLGEDYNHLLFELEVQAGNYKKAIEIFNNFPKDKQLLYAPLTAAIENDAEKLSKAFEALVKNFQSENFPIFSAEAQKLKKDYPQVIEIVALQLLAALKREDKQKIKNLSALLEQLDSSHPVLLKTKQRQSAKNIFGPAMLLVLLVFVIANLLLSIWSLTLSEPVAVSGINKKLSEFGKSIENILANSTENSRQLTQLNKNVEDVKAIIESMDLIISRLSAEKANFENENSSVNSNNSPTEKQLDAKLIEKLSNEAEKLSKTAANLDKQIQVLSNKLVELISKTSSFNYKEKDIQKILNDLTLVKNDIKQLNSKISSLKSFDNSGSSNEDSMSTFDTKLEMVLEALKRTDSKVDQLYIVISQINNVEKLNKLSNTVEIMNQELVELSEVSKATHPKIDKSLEQINNVSSNVQALMTQLIQIRQLLEQNVQSLKSPDISSIAKDELNNKLSNLENEISELKSALSTLIKDISIVKTYVALSGNPNGSASSADNSKALSNDGSGATSNSANNLEIDVRKIINDTRDIYELYLVGLSFYSNKKYKESIQILSYVEDKIEGIDIHFKEDTYYYLILSYIKTSDIPNAKRKFEEYKKLYPDGRYVNELQQLF